MDSPVLHIKGSVLVGPHEVREELWVVGGKITYDAPTSGADVQSVDGWAMPGLVDAHCHVGLDADGAVDAATAEAETTCRASCGPAGTSPGHAATSATTLTRSSPRI